MFCWNMVGLNVIYAPGTILTKFIDYNKRVDYDEVDRGRLKE